MADIYDLEIDLDADTSHSRCIRLIGHGKRVLEFGCATGYVSRILTGQFDCTVTGIEVNPTAAAAARLRCHRVICGDAETLDYAAELKDERFDVVLFADVLEHLKDPWTVLRRVREFVAAGGYVVASIPNIGHVTVGLDLLTGRFAYRPHGLLDDTHIRFFTRGTIQDLFESTGYSLAEVQRIREEPERAHLAAFPREVVDFALRQDEALTYQFIVKAFPATELAALSRLRQQVAELEASHGAEGRKFRQQLDALEAAHEEECRGLRQGIEQAQQAVRRHEAEVVRLVDALEEAHDSEAATRASLEAVVASLSWKVTAPLRRLKAAVGPRMGELTRAMRRGRVVESTSRSVLALASLLQPGRQPAPALPSSDEDYRDLSRDLARRPRGGESMPSARIPMISLEGRDLRIHAQGLALPREPEVDVSIVIPVYDNIRLTMECLTSIAQCADHVRYEVIAVNDASPDDTKLVLPLVPNLVYLENSVNLGFLRTCNRAADHARGEYLLILNNDVQVTPGWLGALVETFSQHERVGAVGPKVLYPDGRLQEAGSIIEVDGSTRFVGGLDDPQRPRYNYAREIDYCSGVCLMVRRDCFVEIGRFNEALAPIYYEDVDLCLRLRARGLRIFYNPAAQIVHHLSAWANTVGPTHKLDLVRRNRQRLLETWLEDIETLNRVRLIAFYLPQYHPIPENDRWWGRGFTEWTNVAKARPNFAGHYQPHLPGDLGFYDLRLESVLEEQAALARRYGIHGFCYYYYWFHGQRMLELPLERMLATGKPDFPFCLCWANENWTRRWDGLEHEILMAQRHSPEDDEAVIRDLIRYFRHRNYIRIDGRPLFLVYRVDEFPDMKRTVAIWREACRAAGVGNPYLARVESFDLAAQPAPPADFGGDAGVEFPPHGSWGAPTIRPPGPLLNADFAGTIVDYREVVRSRMRRDLPGYVRFRTAMPSWDNTARRQDHAFIFHHSSPGAFQAWLEAVIDDTREQLCGDERIVFLNAWNEWAEGNHLEPDQRFGHGYLEAVRNALDRALLRTPRGS